MRWKQFLTPVSNMDTNEAKNFLDIHKEGEYTLLDVRQPSEYQEAHIPGTKLIPVSELPDRLNELDPSKPVVVY